jgi:hypothetical protein
MTEQEIHYLKSILGNLRELKSFTNKRMKSGAISVLGAMVLTDNIEWLEDFVERADGPK